MFSLGITGKLPKLPEREAESPAASQTTVGLKDSYGALLKEEGRCKQHRIELERRKKQLEGMTEAHIAGWKSPPAISLGTAGQRALEKLDALCVSERLHEDREGNPAFNGAALLLLTPDKLQLWEDMVGHGRSRDGSEERLARIRAACGPALKMAYAQQPVSTGSHNRCSSPDSSAGLVDRLPNYLYPVERHEEHASLLADVLEWEEDKAAEDGPSFAQANIHTCGFFSGVGKTSAAVRAAAPEAADLQALGEKLACTTSVKELPRVLACLRLPVRIPDLCHEAKSCHSSLAAVAMMLWRAFQAVAREQLNLEASIPDNESFDCPEEVLDAVRKVLGDRVQLMLHLDDTQEVAVLAEVWYANLLEDFKRMLSVSAPKSGKSFVKDLAATYGLWHDLGEAIRSPGVCGFFTGRTQVPYLVGTHYASVPHKAFLGEAYPLVLPSLSKQGILQTCEKTCCPSGRSVIEALGFELKHVRELEQSRRLEAPVLDSAAGLVSAPISEGSLLRRLKADVDGGTGAAGSSGIAMLQAAEQPACLHRKGATVGGAGEASAASATTAAAPQLMANSPGKVRRVRKMTNQPDSSRTPISRQLRKRSLAGNAPSAPARLTQDTEASEGAPLPLKRKRLEAGDTSELLQASHEENSWDMSDKARRLGRFIREIQWLTNGVPLLVRVALQKAVERAPQENWPGRSLQDISGILSKKGAPYSKAVAAHLRSLMGFNMAKLSSQEQMQLLTDMSRRLRAPAHFL